jgi:hypothetical protein
MAPDLYDLRKHVEPQAVREQVKQRLRERLHGVLGLVRHRQAKILQPGEDQIRLAREAGKTVSRRSG